MDSQATIDLIEKKPKGILAILDDESFFPSATDSTFAQKLHAANDGKHPKYTKPRVGNQGNFLVSHYAGQVEYDTTQWLEKNKDPLQQDLEALVKNSGDQYVAAFCTQYTLNRSDAASVETADSEAFKAAGGSKGGSKKKGAAFITVAAQYRDQLQELMDTLGATAPHFIRCILPNRYATLKTFTFANR